MFVKPRKYAVNCIVSCICASNELFFCLLFLAYPSGGKHAARRELSMPFFTPIYALCMAILWFHVATR